MSKSACPNCGSTNIETDLSMGNRICRNCFVVVEDGILVSEVGFAEGAGGRVHVQGTFVSHFATGFGGKGSEQSLEQTKNQGKDRIRRTAETMGIHAGIWRSAQRFFTLCVDNKFNKGRKSEYLDASCLYLACRLQKSDKMLIDFSERLTVNVFELGATYIKLRSALELKEPMPEVDPAIYNIRFANRLDFGSDNIKQIAADAAKLVRRFKADWMTQGRRPAGVAGACLIIAARMSGFLRTPEEVAQVVKVAPNTIKRRLTEFAKTKGAAKTVGEWRQMTDKELDDITVGEAPPVVKENKRKAEVLAERIRIERLREQGAELDEDAGTEHGDEESIAGPSKKRRKGKKVAADPQRGRGEGEIEADEDDDGAILAAAEDYGDDEEVDEDDIDDRSLEAMDQGEYIQELNSARDNPEAVRAENAKAARVLKREMKKAQGEAPQAAIEPEEDDDLADFDGIKDASDLEEEEEEEEGKAAGEGFDDDAELAAFEDWEDETKMSNFLAKRYFNDEVQALRMNEEEIKTKVRSWIRDRDPREVVQEMRIVEMARAERERFAKEVKEVVDDRWDEELERQFVMRPEEQLLKTRTWLSTNSGWLEQEAQRKQKRAEYARTHGHDPSQPKPKKKQKSAFHRGPYNSAREAIEGIANVKKFSNRLNYNALQNLGLQDDKTDEYGGGLEAFDDEKQDDEKDDDDPSQW